MAHSEQVFRREGDYWTVSYQAVTCRLRDSKGMRYLAYLLTHPGQEVSCVELAALAQKPGPQTPSTAAAAERARVAVTKNFKVALGHIRLHHPALADHLDATIRRGYACVYRPDPRVPIDWT